MVADQHTLYNTTVVEAVSTTLVTSLVTSVMRFIKLAIAPNDDTFRLDQISSLIQLTV